MVTCVHRGSSGGGGWSDERGALPGEVVVVEERGPAGQDRGHRGGGRRVEGQGAEVLDHDQVGVVEGGGQLATGSAGPAAPWPDPGTSRSTGPAPATVKVVKPSEARAPLPLGRLDGDPVGAAEAEREEGGGRDGRTVAARPRTRAVPAAAGTPRRTIRGGRDYRRPVPEELAPDRPAGSDGRRAARPSGDGAGPHAHHQPARAPQRHDVGGHARPARGTWREAKDRPRGPGGGPGRRRRPGLLRRRRPVGHGAGGHGRRRRRLRRPPRGPRLAGRAVRGPVAPGQADHRPGPGLGHGRRVRPGPGLRHGGGLRAGPLRRPRDQRGPVALHDHRAPGPLDAAEEGARADADRPGRRGRRGRAHRLRRPGSCPTTGSTPRWRSWPPSWPRSRRA